MRLIIVAATCAAGWLAVALPAAAAGDATPPAVQITTPAANASVTGIVPISVHASDASGVQNLVLSIDGAPVASAGGVATLDYSWDTTQGAEGASHTLHADAYDTAWNRGQAQITVNRAGPARAGTGDARHRQRRRGDRNGRHLSARVGRGGGHATGALDRRTGGGRSAQRDDARLRLERERAARDFPAHGAVGCLRRGRQPQHAIGHRVDPRREQPGDHVHEPDRGERDDRHGPRRRARERRLGRPATGAVGGRSGSSPSSRPATLSAIRGTPAANRAERATRSTPMPTTRSDISRACRARS